MTLKEFTKNTIVEIVEGVIEANNSLQEKGAFISASSLSNAVRDAQVPILYARDSDNKIHAVTNVDFDIAISISDNNETEAGGGLRLNVFSCGAKTTDISNNEIVNRVKFTLPLALPHNNN